MGLIPFKSTLALGQTQQLERDKHQFIRPQHMCSVTLIMLLPYLIYKK
jgi:hypothetical protein